MKIKNIKGNWYYSDGTEMECKYHEDKSTPAWKSHDGIIRLMNYENKKEANKQIKQLYEVFCND